MAADEEKSKPQGRIAVVVAGVSGLAAILAAIFSYDASVRTAQLQQRASLESTGTNWDLERVKTIFALARQSHKENEAGPSFADWVCYYGMVYDCAIQVWNADAGYINQIDPKLCRPVPAVETFDVCPYTPIARPLPN